MRMVAAFFTPLTLVTFHTVCDLFVKCFGACDHYFYSYKRIYRWRMLHTLSLTELLWISKSFRDTVKFHTKKICWKYCCSISVIVDLLNENPGLIFNEKHCIFISISRFLQHLCYVCWERSKHTHTCVCVMCMLFN